MVQTYTKPAIETVPTHARPGKVHPGFVLALALAAPGGMLLAALAVSLLMNGAGGALGMAWAVGGFVLLAWTTIFGGAVLLAETEG